MTAQKYIIKTMMMKSWLEKKIKLSATSVQVGCFFPTAKKPNEREFNEQINFQSTKLFNGSCHRTVKYVVIFFWSKIEEKKNKNESGMEKRIKT